MENIMGLILAAGKGSRLFPITQEMPKSLLPVVNKSIIEHQIEILKNLGVFDIVIVVGQYGFQITKQVGDGEKYGVRIRYVEQKEPMGSANAVAAAGKFITKPFILLMGDIYFRIDFTEFEKALKFFKENNFPGIVAVKEVDNKEEIKENFNVITDEKNRIIKVIEKPRRVVNAVKGCGIYLFDDSIFEAIIRTPRTALRNEFEFTESIQIYIDMGYPVYSANIIEHDNNINYAPDLHRVNMGALREYQNGSGLKGNLIGANVKIGNNVEIENSIVGDYAIIEDDCIVKDSVIMHGSLLTSGMNAQKSIYVADKKIQV